MGRRDRRANVRARTARWLVAEMEALSFGSDPDEYLRAYLLEGVSWRNQYVRVVHGELTLDEIREASAWAMWHSDALPAVRRGRRDRDRRAAASRPPEDPPAIPPPPPPPQREAVVENAPPAARFAPCDELAQRIRQIVADRDGVTEGERFGTVAWMVNGNIACGTIGDDLLVRVAVCERDRILAEASARPVTAGARTMRGFVAIDSAAIADDAELARWIDAAAGYAAWLPPR